LQGLSRSVLSALLLATFALGVGYSIVLPILPFLIERISGTANDAAALSWHTGLLSGTYILAVFIFAPLWGKLSDQFGRRPLLLLGLVGLAATLMLVVPFKSLSLLYFGRFLNGLFAAAIAPTAYALVGDHSISKEWRAHRFTLLNVASTLGFFVGPLLGSLALGVPRELMPGVGDNLFFIPFLAASSLALIATAMVLGFVREITPRSRTEVKAATASTPASHVIMLRLGAIAFVSMLAIGAFEVGLALRGKLTLGMDAYQIGVLFAECSIVMLVVQSLIFSPLIKPDVTRRFVTPSLAVLGLGLALVPLASGYGGLTIAVALVAATAGILPPIAIFWVSLGSGATEGAELGRITAAQSLGQVLGSVGGGLMFDVSIIPNATFNVAAIVVLTGLAASFGLPRLLLARPDSNGASEDGRV
jgi:MFS family permease